MLLSFSINVTDMGLRLAVTLFLSVKQPSSPQKTTQKVLGPPFISVTQSINDMLIESSSLMA